MDDAGIITLSMEALLKLISSFTVLQGNKMKKVERQKQRFNRQST